MTRLLALAAILASLALVACGDDDDDSDSAASNGATEEAAQSAEAEAGAAADAEAGGGSGAGGAGGSGGGAAGVKIATGDSQFGEVLFDGDDQAIYYFDKETGERSECYDACAEAWPPVLTEGDPKADGGVDSQLLGTTERDDGSTQVTYDGRPLYYYAHEGPSEVACHNVDEFGGLWLAVQPSGEAVPSA